MAFNPAPEVKVARDAATKLKAKQCIIVWIDDAGEHLGMASYGKTASLCAKAKKLGNVLYARAMSMFECGDLT